MDNIQTNVIRCGDNLEIMHKMPDESVDLCYLDPPFFSGRNYDVIWEGEGDHSEIRSFKDTEWYRVQCPKCDREVVKAENFCSACGASLEDAKVVSKNDIYAYIDWMVPRLKEMHRILSPTGSIYLHCDWHAQAYLKIEMDRIFGMENFRNEIVWSYKRWTSSKTTLPRTHDTVLWYTKTDKYEFSQPMQPNTKPNTSQYVSAKDKNGKTVTLKDKNGKPVKREVAKEIQIGDVWELPILSPNAKERLGYPTQKPEVLLERIIKASSNEGDIVFDPFCGCATTMAVAKKLGRKWIGIDVSWRACKVIAERLNIPIHSIKNMPLKNDDFTKMEPMEFQQWACDQMQANNVMSGGGADGGTDGIVKSNLLTTGYEGSPIQVKRSKNVGVNVVKALFATMHDRNIKTGFIVALSFGKGAVEKVAKYKNEGSVEIALINAEDIAEKGYFKS